MENSSHRFVFTCNDLDKKQFTCFREIWAFPYMNTLTSLFYLQLLEMLKFYAGFEINEQTGEALTDTEMMIMHYDRITSLQVCV